MFSNFSLLVVDLFDLSEGTFSKRRFVKFFLNKHITNFGISRKFLNKNEAIEMAVKHVVFTLLP